MTHRCHWPGCPVEVKPALYMCKDHWFTLPRPLRNQIWATYVPGQEVTKTPSVEYLAASQACMTWIAAQQSLPPRRQPPPAPRWRPRR